MSIADTETPWPALHPETAFDGVIGRLWGTRRMDTADIAKQLNLPESFIAHRLTVIRDAGRS